MLRSHLSPLALYFELQNEVVDIYSIALVDV